MAIATGAQEPGHRPKSPFLGAAIDLARSMRLRLAQADHAAIDQSDPDSDDKVAIRAWWTLVMLDRWRSIGTADETMIHNDSVVIVAGLRSVFGEAGYSLIRESIPKCIYIHEALSDLLTLSRVVQPSWTLCSRGPGPAT
jgi:hypothetical protein